MVEKFESKSEAEVLELFEGYLDEVEANEYTSYPSKSKFAKYLGLSRNEVYSYFSAHPHAKAKMEDMMSDVLVEGMLLKKYVPSGAIFTLKNVCKWQDAPKQSKSQSEKTSEKERQKLLDEYMQEHGGKLYVAK